MAISDGDLRIRYDCDDTSLLICDNALFHVMQDVLFMSIRHLLQCTTYDQPPCELNDGYLFLR